MACAPGTVPAIPGPNERGEDMLTLEQIYDIINDHFTEPGDASIWADMPGDGELIIGSGQRQCTIRVSEPGVTAVSMEFAPDDEED